MGVVVGKKGVGLVFALSPFSKKSNDPCFRVIAHGTHRKSRDFGRFSAGTRVSSSSRSARTCVTPSLCCSRP